MYWKWRTASGFWGWAVFKRVRGGSGETDAQLVVNMRVRVYPGTQAESRGAIVEDFGEMAAQPVDLGGKHFADPARRWAVQLDTGDLVFVDTDQLVPE
jgi:hypothetical protein